MTPPTQRRPRVSEVLACGTNIEVEALLVEAY